MNFLQKRNIPNFLTIIRLLLVPLILIFLFVPFGNTFVYEFVWLNSVTKVSYGFLVSGILFAISSFTDFLDGYLARKFHWESNFGKIWDPIADKILVNSVLICFSVMNIVPWFLVILNIVRDTIVDAYRVSIAVKNIIVPANIWGKLKTIFQMLGIIIIYFVFSENKNLYSFDFLLVQNLVLFIATLFSIVSGIIYVYSINMRIKELNNQEKNKLE